MVNKILCTCTNCKREMGSQGKLISYKTHSRHMKNEKIYYPDPDNIPFIPDDTRFSSGSMPAQSDTRFSSSSIPAQSMPTQSTDFEPQELLESASESEFEESLEGIPEEISEQNLVDSDDSESDISSKLVDIESDNSSEEFNVPEEIEFSSDFSNVLILFFLLLIILANLLIKTPSFHFS